MNGTHKKMQRIGVVIVSLILLVAIGYGLFTTPEMCGVQHDDLMGMLAIGFGLGCMPWVPGTAGALGGILLSLAISRLTLSRQLIAISLLIIVAIPISEYGERLFESKDASLIVADELLTFPLSALGLPVHQHPALLAGIFLGNRVFDWTKPPPASTVESIPGGVGIVLDDVVASLFTLLIFSLGWRWWQRRTVNKPAQK